MSDWPRTKDLNRPFLHRARLGFSISFLDATLRAPCGPGRAETSIWLELDQIDMNPAELDAIVEEICRSKKYQGLALETVRDVLALELSRQKSPARAIELGRRRLHRLWAQFLGEPEYESSENALDAAFASGSDHEIRIRLRNDPRHSCLRSGTPRGRRPALCRAICDHG